LSEDLTPEDVKSYIKEEEEEEVVERLTRRGRPPKKVTPEITKDIEEVLKKVDGASALRLMNYLHRSYLSWITEAEAEKYYTVTRQAFSEALTQQQQVIREIMNNVAQQLQNTIAPALNTVSKVLETIEDRVKSLEKITSKPAIDERLILLGGVLVKAFKDKIGLPKELSDIVDYVIYDIAKGLLRPRREEREEEKEEAEGGQQ